MDQPNAFARLAGASILASAGAGLLVPPLVGLALSARYLAAGGSFGEVIGAAPGAAGIMLILGWFAAFPAILYGTLPALIIGGSLSAASRRHRWAATRPAWAAAGAAGGALVIAALYLRTEPPPILPLELMAPVIVLAGAGGGLAFRSFTGLGFGEP